jgi:hypothetical protein
MDNGQIVIAKHGTTTFTGSAIEAYRGHAVWMVLRMWGRGFTDRRIQGLTKREALDIAGEMIGKKYALKDLDEATEHLEAKWKEILGSASVVHEA